MTDFYKTGHIHQYPKGTEFVYSNLTARKSRIPGIDKIVFFGARYFIKKYLIEAFDDHFFSRDLDSVLEEYRSVLDLCGGGSVDHIAALHELKYLPLEIRALPEGSLVPIGVPCMTIVNTHPEFFWLTNSIETLLSCSIWQACTSATLACRFRGLLDFWANETNKEANWFVDYQGHDFSMRGMSSLESSIISGMGHLMFFKGSDTIPAIMAVSKYYNGLLGNVGGSVPATEHSVMCLGGDEGEFETFKRLITEVYPSGIVSIVSDTWNLWKVVSEFLPRLKDEIMARDGKVVIRPDSSRTSPQDIICGTDSPFESGGWGEVERKGLVEALYDIFGGSVSSEGYKVLDPHIGAIYGDAISYDRCKEICRRLRSKGFASTNVVYGIGSYTYQYNTRDSLGFAVKATWGRVNGQDRDIFKDPITDSGEKKSLKGILRVYSDGDGGGLKVEDQYGNDPRHNHGLMNLIFSNGLMYSEGLQTIRTTAKFSAHYMSLQEKVVD